MFHGTHHIPSGIFLFLSNVDLCTLSCVNRQLDYETRKERNKRKNIFVLSVMNYFHTPYSRIFSLHRTFQDNFKTQIRRLFNLIPEWFEYMGKNNITYMDISNPYYLSSGYYLPILSRVLKRSPNEVIMECMTHLSQNITLTYCNLGMFTNFISRELVEQTFKHHPVITHVELSLYSEQLAPAFPAMSLYRVNDVLEWRHHPPQN